MLKWRGFTIIEVLTTMTILAIVATMAAPEYWKWKDRDSYRAEGQALFDTLLDARSAALTNKVCDDGSLSVRWAVLLDMSVQPMSYRLKCYTDDTNFIEETASVEMSNSVLETLDYNGVAAPAAFDGTTGLTFPDNMLISFFSGGVSVRIDYEKSGTQRAESFQMVIGHDDSGYEHTICFNRVAGFPTFNKTGNTCQDY